MTENFYQIQWTDGSCCQLLLVIQCTHIVKRLCSFTQMETSHKIKLKCEWMEVGSGDYTSECSTAYSGSQSNFICNDTSQFTSWAHYLARAMLHKISDDLYKIRKVSHSKSARKELNVGEDDHDSTTIWTERIHIYTRCKKKSHISNFIKICS